MIISRNNNVDTFGKHIRKLREELNLPIRKVAAVIDIDPSTMSKIERGQRTANKNMISPLAKLFNVSEETLKKILLSDKIVNDLLTEKDAIEILKISEEKLVYVRLKNQKQAKIDFE